MSTLLINRYPGTRPFADDPNDQRLFYGRDEEIDTLFHRVCAARLLVLFGKSGLGKTSLLQAGVYPKLRERQLLPIPVRLNIQKTPLAIIEASADQACRNTGIDYTPGIGETLWEFFKTAMFWQGEVLLTPVLVFDQFEEIFTLKNTGERATLARELGDLFRGTLPQSVRQLRQYSVLLEGNITSVGNTLSEQPPNVRVILSLREDYLGSLQELAADIPGIYDDRVRLSPLTKEQAEQAIRAPAALSQDAATGGQFITPSFAYADDALTEILGYLRGKSDVIEPFQLQLVCRSIEEQVAQQKANPLAIFTSKELGGCKRLDKIVQNFYRQTLAKLPKHDRQYAQRLCEEGLLNAEGFRLMLQENEILRSYKLSKKALDALVDARLLRKEPRLESYFYELSHDSLAQPILDSRPQGIWQRKAESEANAAKSAQQAREAAEEVLNYLVSDLRDKLTQMGCLNIVEEVQQRVNEYYENVSVSFDNLGDVLNTQGKLTEAQQYYQENLAIRQKLTALDPSNTGWQRDFSVSLNKLGDVLKAQDKLTEAQRYYQESLEIRQKLTALDSNNTEWQRDVSVSFDKLGDVLYAQGKLKEAQQHYQNCLAIRQKITAEDPNNIAYQRDVSVSFNRIGDVLNAQGKLTEALQYYQDDLAIAQKLAALDPSNTEWQRDVSVSLDKLGNVLNAQAKLTKAQQYYQDGLAIMQKLTTQNPSNTGWQRDLSVSYEKVANVFLAQKKVSEALELYQKDLNICERLAILDPSNATWQSDLSSVYDLILPLLFELNRYTEAVEISQRRVAHALKQVDSQPNKQTLANYYVNLAWYELFNRKPKNAIEASEQGLKVNADESRNTGLNINLAHGYLFSGQYQKAKELYLNYKDKIVSDGRSFKQIVLDDFNVLRKRGINHADMKKIQKLLH